MPKERQHTFAEGAAVLIIATALAKIIGAVFKIPLNNIIGDLGFGYYSSAYDLFVPIYSVSMTGLPIVVSRMVAERVAKGQHTCAKRVFSVSLAAFSVVGIVFTLLMLLVIKPFLALTDMTGATYYSLIVIAPAVFFSFVISAFRGYYEGYGNMYPTAISNVIEAISKLIFGYTFAYIAVKLCNNVAYAAAAAILGVTIGVALATLFSFVYHKANGKVLQYTENLSEPKSEILKTVILLAIPIVLSSLVTNIASLIDVLTVKWQLGNLIAKNTDLFQNMYSASIDDYNSTHNVLSNDSLPTFLYGIRSKTYTIYNLVPSVAAVLGISALPSLVRVWCAQERNSEEVKNCIDSVIKTTSVIVLPAAIGMTALSPQIMSLLYKSHASVEIGAPLLRIYGIAAIFAGLSVPLVSMLQAVGKTYVPVYNMLIGATVKTVLNVVLISFAKVNIKGAAYGTLACFVIIFLLDFYALCKYTKVKPDVFSGVLKPLFAAVLCGATAYFSSALLGDGTLKTAVSIVLAAVVYFVLLFVFSVIKWNDVCNSSVVKRLKVFTKGQ